MIDASPRQRRTAATHGRLAAWLIIIVFMLQFLAATQHHHDAAAKTPHCVACTLHAQPHAAPPDATLAVAAFSRHVLHRLFYANLAQELVAYVDFLLPPSHGPPAFLPTH